MDSGAGELVQSKLPRLLLAMVKFTILSLPVVLNDAVPAVELAVYGATVPVAVAITPAEGTVSGIVTVKLVLTDWVAGVAPVADIPVAIMPDTCFPLTRLAIEAGMVILMAYPLTLKVDPAGTDDGTEPSVTVLTKFTVPITGTPVHDMV